MAWRWLPTWWPRGLRDQSMSWAVLSLLGLEKALTAELFLKKGTVLVKAPLDPGDATSFAHPQLPAHQPDEALIVGHQNHATLKDRRPEALRGKGPKGH